MGAEPGRHSKELLLYTHTQGICSAVFLNHRHIKKLVTESRVGLNDGVSFDQARPVCNSIGLQLIKASQIYCSIRVRSPRIKVYRNSGLWRWSAAAYFWFRTEPCLEARVRGVSRGAAACRAGRQTGAAASWRCSSSSSRPTASFQALRILQHLLNEWRHGAGDLHFQRYYPFRS